MFKDVPKPIYCLRDGKLGEISSLCFGKDDNNSNLLYNTCTNGYITIWNLKTFRISSLTKVNNKGLLWISSHENQLYTQGRDGFIRVWDSNTMNEYDKIYSTQIGFCKPSITNGTIVAPTDNTNKLALKSCKNLNNGITLSHCDNSGLCMCLKSYENNVTMVIAGYENGNVIHWDSRNNKTPLSNTKTHKEAVMCLDFDNKGVSGSPDDKLCVWDLDLKKTEIKITNPGVASARIRRDARILATGGWDGRIRLFGWRTLKPLAVLDFHAKTVQCVEFSDRPTMAAGSTDGRISLWNLYGDLKQNTTTTSQAF